MYESGVRVPLRRVKPIIRDVFLKSNKFSGPLEYFIESLRFDHKSIFYDTWYIAAPGTAIYALMLEWRKRILPRMNYKNNVFDCDDYASYFRVFAKSFLSADGFVGRVYRYPIPGFNGVGTVIGLLKDPSSGRAGWHAWNIILHAKSDNSIEALMVEPQTGELVLFYKDEKGRGYYEHNDFAYIVKYVIM